MALAAPRADGVCHTEGAIPRSSWACKFMSLLTFMATASVVMAPPPAATDESFILAHVRRQLILNRLACFFERCWQFRGIFAAGLRHVGATAT